MSLLSKKHSILPNSLLTKPEVNSIIHGSLEQAVKSYIASQVCHKITSISRLLMSLLLKCFVSL